MAEIHTWSRYAVDNNLPSPDGWLEHIPSKANNDIAREMMAALARHSIVVHGYPTSTGEENNSYKITSEQDIPTLFQGLRASFTAHRDSVDGAGTFCIGTTPSKSLVGLSATGLAAGEIVAGRLYDVVYSGQRFQIINPSVMNGGLVRLNALPTFLGGKSAPTVDGFSFSTAATGTDANTIYFRSTGIFHGSDEITSLVAGGETINEVSVGSTVVYALPKTPLNFRARRVAVIARLDLSWTNASNDTLDSVLTYRLERALNAAFTDTLTVLDSAQVASDTTYGDTGVENNTFTQYYYRLRAETSFGVTDYTELNRNTRLQAVSGPFESLTYTLVTGLDGFDDVRLAWSQPEGGDYANLYRVLRSTNGGSFTSITPSISAGGADTVHTHTDNTVSSASGNTYSYRIRASNDASTGADLFSNTVTVNF